VPRFESFILIADTAFALLSLVVSALLFGQVVMVRSWALLALACGFLLVSATTLPQLVRVSHGEFIDSSLRFFTDLALPLAVIAYALLRVTPPARGGGISLLIRGVAATAAIAIVILGMDWAGSDAAAGSIDAATNTPLQALTTLNEKTFVEAAQALGLRVMKEGGPDNRSRASFAFRLCTGRPPMDAELKPLLKFWDEQYRHFEENTAAAVQVASQSTTNPPPDVNLHKAATWAMVSRALLNLDETITKE